MNARMPSSSEPALVQSHDAGSASTGGSQAVGRALSLLSLVGRGGAGGIGLAQLAETAGLARPTARRLLLALGAARLVDQDRQTRRYHLGPEALLLGRFAEDRHGILTQARDAMLRLARETGDTVLLTVPQDDHTLCLERVEGSFPVRTHALMRGDRKPAGVGAGALALLAALPEAEAQGLISRARPAIDAIAPDLFDSISHDIGTARGLGYALNPGRVVPGSWGIGMAILWPDGRPAGALSLAAIEDRMRPDRRRVLIEALRREISLIEGQLAALGTPTSSSTRHGKGTP